MTFATEAKLFGRRPFVIVELDLDFCGNTYGSAPCTAALSAGNECYNTYDECQDQANYVKTTKTYQYSDILLVGQGIPPLIKSVNTAPTEITPGKGLGVRASCSVSLNDIIDDDRQTDPYYATRDYIATDQGTYCGKLAARNPHYYRREMRVKYGFIESDGALTSVETYTYLIDSMSYDNKRGQLKINGKDPLTLSDKLKTKTPLASKGKLYADITSSATSLSVRSGQGADYDASGRIDIGGEIIEYTTLTADTFTGLTRGAQRTTAKEHSTDDTVQKVRYWGAVRPELVLQDLLEDDAGIPTAYIPIADWITEADQWLSSHFLSTNITKPTDVNTLVNEIMEQCGISLWSDDRDGAKIKLKVEAPLLGSELASVETLFDKDIIKDTLKVSDDTKARISSVWFHHTLDDPKEGIKKQSNYLLTEVQADSESYSVNAYNKEQVKQIFSRWVRSSTVAKITSSRLVSRFSSTPKRLEFLIDPAAFVLSVGDHFFLESQDLQGSSGAAQNFEFQITSIDYIPDRSYYKVKALEFNFSNKTRLFVVAPPGIPDYTLASDAEKALYGFVADPATELMSDGSPPYLVL